MSEFRRSGEFLDTNQLAEFLEAEIRTFGDAEIYTEHLADRFKGQGAYRTLNTIARFIEPEDRELKKDAGYPYGSAFRNGGLLGLSVAKELLGPDFSRRLAAVKIGLPSFELETWDDEFDQRLKTVEELVGYAESGYEQAEDFHGVFELYEHQLADVSYQHYLRLGFGFIFAHIQTVITEEARSSLERQISNGIDWDEELKKL